MSTLPMSTSSEMFPASSSPNGSYVLLKNATEPEQPIKYWSFTFTVIVVTILSISAFLSLVGNAMVITVVIRHRGMRTRTNLFLVNLAVADFLVGGLAVPAAIVTLINKTWIFGDVYCQIDGFINCFCLVTSIHTLMYISIHKYFSITRPFNNSFKLRRIIIMIAAAWIWGAFCSVITLTGLTHVDYKPGTSQCGPVYPHETKSYIHHAIIQITNIFIPLVILVFCYGRMFREIRAHTKRLQENTTLEHDVVLAQQKKVTVTLFIVLACFIICWMPYHIYASYTSYQKDKEHFGGFINPLAYMFGFLNSACNPIIYAFRSPSFREGYKEILCQTPTYVISDDTIHEEEESPFRRLSSFWSSMRSTVRRSTSVQDDLQKVSTTSLPGSINSAPNTKFKRGKSLTELMRAVPRTGNANSIIQRDGSVVIMKGGKIVSVRRQNEFFSGNPIVHGRKKIPVKVTNCNLTHKGKFSGGDAIELAPLIVNGRLSSAELKTEDDSSFGSDEVFDKTSQKVECIEENSICKELVTDTDSQSSEKITVPHIEVMGASDSESVNETLSNKGDSKVDIIISIGKDDSILNVMPLTPSTKERFARSELFLDSQEPVESKIQMAHSTDAVFKPTIKRFPSVEHLDLPKGIPRSASDTNMKNKSSPLTQRRWTFTKGGSHKKSCENL